MKRTSRSRGVAKSMLPAGTERVTNKNGQRVWFLMVGRKKFEAPTMREFLTLIKQKEDAKGKKKGKQVKENSDAK